MPPFLSPCQPFVRAVAVDQATRVGELLRDRLNSHAHPRIRGWQEAHDW